MNIPGRLFFQGLPFKLNIIRSQPRGQLRRGRPYGKDKFPTLRARGSEELIGGNLPDSPH